jgi:hypothetical protein
MGLSRRLELQALLEAVLGSTQVHFQPPESERMTYPCIVYQRDANRTDFADNRPYSHTQRYQLTAITTDPDDDLPERLKQLPMCLFNRFFVANNLNHDVFTIHF